jgi:outer membrane protein assembly factor BamB
LATFAKLIAYSPSLKTPPPVPSQQQWQYKVPNPNGSWIVPILDLWVDDQGCWLCLRDGRIVVLNHQGDLIQQYPLPKDSRCLAVLEETPYAACQNGNLYELTGKLPQAVYDLRPLNQSYYQYLILALEAGQHHLAVANAYGYLEVLNTELRRQWQHHEPDHWQSWFLGSDQQTLYQGDYRGVTAYDLSTGKRQWFQALETPVLCGLVTAEHLLIACANRTLYRLEKVPDLKTREVSVTPLYTSTDIPYCLALAEDRTSFWLGNHQGILEQLDFNGVVQAKIPLGAGGITAIQAWQEALYVTTGQGKIICLQGI